MKINGNECTMTALINLETYTTTKQSVPCNLCGDDRTEPLCTEQRFKTGIPVVICKTCGLVYLNPRWSDTAYRKFYTEDYRKLMGEHEIPAAECARRQRVHGSRILSFCRDLIAPKTKVVDIGCGAGGILWTFRQAFDCEVCGIEPSVEYARYARDQLGIDVSAGPLESYSGGENTFDLAIVTQTLNHMLDPLGALRRIHRMLRIQGKLFVEVQHYPEYAKIKRASTQVDHTYYFCPETLECMLRKAGFSALKTEIDTAESARLVHPYMRHRSAHIHMRFLILKEEPLDTVTYPDYRPIKEGILSGFARWSTVPVWRKILRAGKRLLRGG